MTLNNIKKIIKTLDPPFSERDEGFKCAVVLLACMQKPHRIKDIVEFTKIDRPLVVKYIRNFRANKFFTNTGKVKHSGWFDEKTGGIAFYCDVNIGLGYLRREKVSKNVVNIHSA
jgi:hypothetical protein